MTEEEHLSNEFGNPGAAIQAHEALECTGGLCRSRHSGWQAILKLLSITTVYAELV